MRLKRGTQFFTTGNPNRNYSNLRESDKFSGTNAFTRNSLPGVIVYLDFLDGTFFDSYAWRTEDKYRLEDGQMLSREEVIRMHRDTKTLRAVSNIVHRRAKPFSRIVEIAQRELGISEEEARVNLGYLIVNGAAGYNVLGRVTTRF